MRKFKFDDNEDWHQDEIESFFEGGGDDQEFIGDRNLSDAIQLRIVEVNFNIKILKMSIKVAQKCWYWIFLPLSWKAYRIIKVYTLLSQLVSIEEAELEQSDTPAIEVSEEEDEEED